MTITCTITKAEGLCGAPAVTTFKSSRGQLFHECVDHAVHGQHLLTCEKPLALCTICGGEFGLVKAPPETPHPFGGQW